MEHRVAHPTEDGGVLFFCPGCLCGHRVWIREPSPSGSQWKWNGSLDAPTFSPSILVTWTVETPGTPQQIHKRCHSHVENGRIIFLDDCTHPLRGQTVPLQPF